MVENKDLKMDQTPQRQNQNQRILPLAPVERIIKKANADRISEGATIELAKILEDYGVKLASEAVRLAKHAGRNTVRDEDLRLAKMMMSKVREQ